MPVPNSLPGVDTENFYWINKNFNLLVELDEKSGDYQSHRDSSSWDLEYMHQIS